MRLRLGGEERWVAAEDAGLYRDALGAVPPGGLPEAFLEDVPDALRELVAPLRAHPRPVHHRRAARPLRRRSGARVARARARGRARARRAAPRRQRARVVRRRGAAAAAPRLAGRAAQGDRARRPARVRRASCPRGRASTGIRPAAPASTGCARCSCRCRAWPCRWRRGRSDVLPRRVGAWSPTWLDQLCAAGELVWVGAGAIGRARAAWPCTSARTRRCSAAAQARRTPPATADARGRSAPGCAPAPCFFTDLLADVPLDPAMLQEALWDLVWAGEVTNDAWAPLRAPRLTLARARRERPRQARAGASPRAAPARARRSRAAGR